MTRTVPPCKLMQAALTVMLARILMRMFETLFDPQTSGGLLGVFSRDSANSLVATLHKEWQTAAIIGKLDFTNAGIHLTENM